MDLLKLFKKAPVPTTEVALAVSPYAIQGARWSNADESVDNALAKFGYQIYKDMMSDGVVKSCMQVKIYGVTVGGWDVLPAVGDADPRYQEAQDIATFVKWNLSEMSGSVESVLASIAGPAMKNGFSVNEINWKMLEKEPYSGMVGLDCIKLRPSETFTFDIDQFGNVNGLIQRIMGNEIHVPLDKVLLFTYDPQQTGLPQGCSDLRAAYGPYKEKLAHRQYRSVAGDKYSTPLAVGHYPPGTPKADQEKFLAVLKTIAVDTAIALPTGMEVEFLQASQSVMAPFTETIDSCNKEISRAILGQVLATDEGKTGTGSYAQARIHEGILGMFLTDLRENVSETVLYEQLVKRLVDFNYDTDLYPKIKLAAPSKDDLIALANAYDIMMKNGAVDPSEQFMRQTLGWPVMPQALMEQRKQAELDAQKALPAPPVGGDEPDAPVETPAKAPETPVKRPVAPMSTGSMKATPLEGTL